MKKIALLVFAVCGFVMAAASDVKFLLSEKYETTGLWGFKYEGDDKWCILPQYDYAQSFFKNKTTIVRKNKKYFVINLNGEQVSPLFDDLQNVGYTYLGKNDGKYMLYDPLFVQKSETKYDYIHNMYSTYVLSYILHYGDKCYGLMDINGKEILSPIYNNIDRLDIDDLDCYFGNNYSNKENFIKCYFIVEDKNEK